MAGKRAKLIDGVAHAPALAPPAVQAAVWAANQIVGKPYRWGGGHGKWTDTGYDCSGAVSFALHGGELLDSPLDSGSFMRWGRRGRGDWITVYTNPGHAYAVIAGLRLDTSAVNDRSGRKGPHGAPGRGRRAASARGIPRAFESGRSSPASRRWLDDLLPLGEAVRAAQLRLGLASDLLGRGRRSAAATAAGRPSSSRATIVR